MTLMQAAIETATIVAAALICAVCWQGLDHVWRDLRRVK
jgi:hypothetical protein